MLLLVTAAEMQYRHESQMRDRDLAHAVLRRQRQEALAAIAVAPARHTVSPRTRAVWPRPIGAQARVARACPAT